MALCMPGSAQPEEPVCLGNEMLVTGLVQSVTGAGRGLGTDLRVLALSVGWWPQAAVLGESGRGTLPGWTWVHIAVGETETVLVGAWLGVDQGERLAASLVSPRPYSWPTQDAVGVVDSAWEDWAVYRQAMPTWLLDPCLHGTDTLS